MSCPGPVYVAAPDKDNNLIVLCDGCDYALTLGPYGFPLNGFPKIQRDHDKRRCIPRQRSA